MVLLLTVLFLLVFGSFGETDVDLDILKNVHRVLQKRDIESNIALDDPRARCRNGGIFSGGRCHCIHPHTGDTCQHFACLHGTSVGPRYDPKSLLFGVPCICDSGWKGEMCDFKPDDQCGNKGEWKVDHCECMGFYFGNECQYTSRCVEGDIKYGRCICKEGFDGDYCDRIVCAYGTPNSTDRTLSCVCPSKFKGRHCNQCKNVGIAWVPYPVCEKNIKMIQSSAHAQEIRAQRKKKQRNQLWIISMCVAALVFTIFMISIGRMIHREKINAERERGRQVQEERHRLLTNHVMLQRLEEDVARESRESLAAGNLESRKRRKSEPALNQTSIQMLDLHAKTSTSAASPSN